MAKATQTEAQNTVDLMFRAFSDRTRLRILHVLRDGELCVGDIVESLRAPQPRISRHLAYSAKGQFGRWFASRASGAIIPWPPPRRRFTASCWSVLESVSSRCPNSRPTTPGPPRSGSLAAAARSRNKRQPRGSKARFVQPLLSNANARTPLTCNLILHRVKDRPEARHGLERWDEGELPFEEAMLEAAEKPLPCRERATAAMGRRTTLSCHKDETPAG